MNILHYTGMPYFTKYGGFEKWIVEFAKIANTYNHKIFVSYTERIDVIPNLNDDFVKYGIEPIVTRNRDKTVLLNQLKDCKIEVFISHFPEPYEEAQFVAKNTKCKVFSFFHCYNYYYKLSWKTNFKEKLASSWYRWMVFQSQFYINHFFAVSKSTKKQFSQYCLIFPKNISHLYLGVNKIDEICNINKTNFNGVPVITCIACHDKCKGLDILIESAKILKERNVKFKILQVGGGMTFNNGEDTKLLKNLVIKYNLTDSFDWLGVRNDIDDILAQTDIYVQPSRREAISLTIAEAMMHSLPIVASNVDGIPEYIDHEITGLLYNNNNPTELANCIQYLIENSNTRRLLGENAYNKINSSTFDMTTNIQFFIDKYINKYV